MMTPFQVNENNYSLHHDANFNAQAHINELARKKWYEVPIPEVGTIIDAGACLGAYSLYMSAFAKRVYAIEPLTASYTYLATNILENKRENIKPFKLALAGSTGERYIYTSFNPNDPSGASLIPLGKMIETVKTKTIAEFIEDEKIDVVHILKTDIEGLEQEVFSADDFGDVANKILCITGEYHLQCPNLREVLEYHGYDYTYLPRGMFVAVRKPKKKVDILLP